MNIKWVEEIDSTNSEVIRNISEWDDMCVLAAKNQTAGRGQRGNSWKIVSGQNLTFSIVLKGNSDAKENSLGFLVARCQFILSQITTLALKEYLDGKGINAKIKWPNDIYVGDKKICGILIENGLSSNGTISYSVIGIGLNINQKEFPPEVLNPTSLSLLTGESYDLEYELAHFCAIFADKLSYLSNPEKAKEDFISFLYRKDKFYDYTDCKTEKVFKGKIIGITDEGLVKMETAEGEIREYAFKEVSYIL